MPQPSIQGCPRSCGTQKLTFCNFRLSCVQQFCKYRLLPAEANKCSVAILKNKIPRRATENTPENPRSNFYAIHSFITSIYIAPLQVGLLRGAPNPNTTK